MKDTPFDYVYAAVKFPPALVRPMIWRGYFPRTKEGAHQETLYRHLLVEGFGRTPWQLVFPNQNAGLVKMLTDQDTELNEAHVRFYTDGAISCELEYDRYGNSQSHLRGRRESGNDFLAEIVDRSFNDKLDKKSIKNLLKERDYSKDAILDPNHPLYRRWAPEVEELDSLARAFLVFGPLGMWQYGPAIVAQIIQVLK
jgi:hypothetical protein